MPELPSPLAPVLDQLKKLAPESLYLLTTLQPWADGNYTVGGKVFATPELRREFYRIIGRPAIVVSAKDACHVIILGADLSIAEIY